MTTIVLMLGAAAGGQQRSSGKADPTERILALDPRWGVEFDTPPAAPPGYDEQTAYVPLKGGELVAVGLEAGDIKWRVALETTSTPATGDGLVFSSGDRLVIAFDQISGEMVWRTPLDAPLASPLHWDAGWLITSTESGDVVALHAEDGRIVWRTPLGSPLAVPPSLADERLYVGLRDGRLAALALDTGVPAWEYALNEPATGLLALEEQLIVGTTANRLHSINLRNGRIRWTQKAGADVRGAPLADEDRIYFAAMDNVLRALDRRSGNIRWTRNLASRPTGGPLLISNVVLVPLVTTDISAFSTATGEPAFTIKAAGELGGVPFLRENAWPTAPRLIAISREGMLQGFASRFDLVPAPLPDLPGVKVTG